MGSEKYRRLTVIRAAAPRLLAALALLLVAPSLSACVTAEGTNAFATPATFEREVMDSTLQGLDIIPQDAKPADDKTRAPLVMPKDTDQLPAPSPDVAVADLPVDSNNPQINTAGLTQANIDELRHARVVDLNSLAGRPLTDTERKQLAARMQAANMQVSSSDSRPLTVPPPEYFSDYKGKDLVCLAKDGTLVSLHDPKCPSEIQKALTKAGPAGNGVDAGISQDLNNAARGLDPNGQ